MSEVIEERQLSAKRREVKRYSDLLKSQLIKARLSGAKFEDLSQAHGPCADSIRRWCAMYHAGLLVLPGLDPVAPKPALAAPKSAPSFVSLSSHQPAGADIQLSFKGAVFELNVAWPVSAALDCSQLIQSLLK